MKIIVDTAVEVFVNVVPLTDDGDFKSREVSVAYNAAGMDLVWNFQTPAGVVAQTAVTPTTGGTYDWSHVGDGMYKIEIPASGGASINNDTEGYGWFSGIATGVLPWVGPIYEFVPANIANSLVIGSDKLEADTVQIEGSDATNQIRDSVVDDATRIDASALNTLSSHDPGEVIMGATDAVVVGTNNDKTGYRLSSQGVIDIEAALLNDGDGQALIDAIISRVESDLDASDLSVAAIATAVRNAVLDRVLATNHEIAGSPGKLLQNLDEAISTRATPAQVNAEVLDVMTVDTFAEPGQGAPAATTSLAVKIGYLFKAWRNRKTQTSGQFSLFNDAANVVDQKSSTSDDGTTFVSGEIGSGP